MIQLAPVEFEVYGLAVPWPRESLTMIDAEGRQPAWGVTLGHSDGSRLIEVTTFGRTQFDRAMAPNGDPAADIAFETTHGQISRSLATLTRPAIDSPPELIRRLSEYAERQARGYQAWAETVWTVDDGTTARRVRAHVNSFAGWHAGFTAKLPEHYVVAYAYRASVADLSLALIDDSRSRYGLDRSRPQLPRHRELYFPYESQQTLHADHLTALAFGPDPDSRIVWPARQT
jgi:hypothetical protein